MRTCSPDVSWDGIAARRCNCPSKCFCKFDPEDLAEVAWRKFVSGESTLDLMRVASNSHERDVVCIVSMLDVGEEMADCLMSQDDVEPTCDVLRCRESLRRSLAKCMRDRGMNDKSVCFSPITLRDSELVRV